MSEPESALPTGRRVASSTDGWPCGMPAINVEIKAKYACAGFMRLMLKGRWTIYANCEKNVVSPID